MKCKFCGGQMVKDDRYSNTYICFQCGSIAEFPNNFGDCGIVWKEKIIKVNCEVKKGNVLKFGSE